MQKSKRDSYPSEDMCWVLNDAPAHPELADGEEDHLLSAWRRRAKTLPWGSNFLRALSFLRGDETKPLPKRLPRG